MKNGEYQDFKNQSQTLLGEQMEKTPHTTNSSIMMEAMKELVGELLLRPKAKTFTFKELLPILDNCKNMNSPNIKNNVTSFKYIQRFRVIDGITILRGCSNCLYVQVNMFLGQGSNFDKVFVFKMSEVDPGNSVDLVKWIQPSVDL